jgi:hypothetical protein
MPRGRSMLTVCMRYVIVMCKFRQTGGKSFSLWNCMIVQHTNDTM